MTDLLDERLQAISKRGHISSERLAMLKTFVQGAPDEKLFRINPLIFAKEQGIPEEEGIELLLNAAHAGIFTLSWGVICDLCGAYLTTPGGLRSLGGEKACAP